MRDLVATRGPASGWARLAHCVFFLILIIVTSFEAPLTEPTEDVFHEGEWTMYGVAGARVPSGQPPLLGFGGIDLIPAQMGAAVCRADGQIVCARVLIEVVTSICAAEFLVVLVLITGLGTIRALIESLPAIATLIAYNGTARSPFALRTGSPNVRELFLLAILICLFLLFRDERQVSARIRYALAAAIGFLAGAGLFWIYDRGVFGVILTVGAIGGLSLLWRDWHPLACAAAGGLVGLGLAHVSGLYGDTWSHFQNMLYWVRHPEIFREIPDIDLIKVSAPVVPLFVILFFWAAFLIWRAPPATRLRLALPLFTTMAVMLFFTEVAYKRPIERYVTHVLWGISLLSATLIHRATRPPAGTSSLATMTAVSIGLSALCMLFNIRYLPPSLPQWASNLASNARAMTGSWPRDGDLVPDGLRQAAEIIRARSPACTYTFSNEGLLYVLANTPPCSRFAYPLYISADNQTEVISEFERSAPPIVLWTSPSWANAILGRGLTRRTPVLAAWVAVQYPYRMTLADGYILGAREPLEGAPK